MKYERLWERLFEFLNDWSTAAEVEPGRIQITVANADGSTRVVEILMTRGEWDDMVSIPFGDFDLAAREVKETLLWLRDDERFLVYSQYELVPSATPALPIDPDDIRLEDLARQHPEGFGRWVVMDRDGNVIDEWVRPQADARGHAKPDHAASSAPLPPLRQVDGAWSARRGKDAS